tara:strand:+ start:208 stop:345 length:138 start_codon:yes stop_codon:yes gene_type:complete
LAVVVEVLMEILKQPLVVYLVVLEEEQETGQCLLHGGLLIRILEV